MPGPNVSNKIGEIKLDEQTKFWHDSLNQDLVFVSNFGKQITFNYLGPYISFEGKDINSKKFESIDDCDGYYKQDFYTVPAVSYLFKSDTISMAITRTKYEAHLSNIRVDTDRIDNLSDQLEVGLYNYRFLIYPRSKSALARYINYDTITLGNKLYNNIIYAYYDTAGNASFRPPIYTYGVYYNIPKGVVGFEF